MFAIVISVVRIPSNALARDSVVPSCNQSGRFCLFQEQIFCVMISTAPAADHCNESYTFLRFPVQTVAYEKRAHDYTRSLSLNTLPSMRIACTWNCALTAHPRVASFLQLKCCYAVGALFLFSQQWQRERNSSDNTRQERTTNKVTDQ